MSCRRVLLAIVSLLLPLLIVPLGGPATEAAPGDPVVPIAGRRTISGDFDTTCVILADTTVQCWGGGWSGQIGDGGEVNRPRPSTVTDLTGVVDISAGHGTACAVTDDQALWCWGSDDNGKLGNGSTITFSAPTPEEVPGMGGTLDVSVGDDHVCAAKVDGSAYCWGAGGDDELATGTTDDQASPFQIPGITDAIATAVAEKGSCVLHRDGTVSCWGSNYDGEVGDGTTDAVTLPLKVPGVTGAIDIEKSDGSATCVLIDDGTVQCWGDGGADWLDSETPVTFPFLDDAIALRITDEVICAIRADFSLWCAGDNDDVLPYNHPVDRETLDPTGIASVADVSLGDRHACVVLATGDVQCWGDNFIYGTVGAGALTESDPVEVDLPHDVTALDAGGNTTCAIVDGEVWCWGRNHQRVVADTDDGEIAAPTRVGTATDLVGVTVAADHACVINSTDKVACWGYNNRGQLGVGDTANRTTPTVVPGNFIAVSAGFDHTCAIRANGAAACWGDNDQGQQGNGTFGGSNVLVPTTIIDDAVDFTAISAGLDFTCGVQGNDKVRCWGDGDTGQLGDGLAASTGTPVLVDDPTSDFELVAAAQDATCASRSVGLTCWGLESTVSGVSSGDQQDTPQDKTIAGTFTSLDSEDLHACAVRVGDGVVHCWGGHGNLRLTSAVTAEEHDPVAITSVGASRAVTTGAAHTCSLGTDRSVSCWGENSFGQIGQPSEFDEPQTLDMAGPALVVVEPPQPPPTIPPTTQPPTGDVDVFTPVEPARLVETRTGPGLETVDGEQQGTGRLDAGGRLTVDIAGRANVPGDAVAAVINITAIGPDAAGFITGHPCLDPAPLASSLNYAAGTNLGNEIIVELDADGNACLDTSAALHLAVDIAAYLPAGTDYDPLEPGRLADTRTNGSADTVDGDFEADGRLDADSEYRVRIAGRNGVADDAQAAVMNVTAIGATGAGYFTVHPCTTPRPTAASLNYVSGVNRGNEIIAPLSSDGDVCVYTSTATHVAIDVVGQITSDDYTPIVPARHLDTRPGQPAIDDAVEDDGVRTSGQITTLSIAGAGDVPDGATTVTLNLTAVGPQSVGYATVFPCLPEPPNTASLNFASGVNGGNEIIAELDDNGDLCIYTSAPTHLTLDIAGHTI